MIQQKKEVEICIDLINWLKDYSLSNEEIFTYIQDSNYIEVTEILDKQRKEKNLTEINLHKSLTTAINNLRDANPKHEIHEQRYNCFCFLSFVSLIENCCLELELSTDEMISCFAKAKDHILQSKVTEFVISKLLENDEVKMCLSLVLKIDNKDYRYSSYRLITHYYGLKGDTSNFLKWLKKCDARKDIMDIQIIKSSFIRIYAEKKSLDEVFTMVDSKGFGKMYLVDALTPFTKTKTFNQIKEIVNTPRFETKKEYVQEIILTNSFNNNKENHTVDNFNDLSQILMTVPARVRCYPSDASLRDNLWSRVCESLIEHDTTIFKTQIAFAIKKINAKWLKKAIKERISK